VINFPVSSWHAFSAAIPLALITMPEKWFRLQALFGAAIAENIVLAKFINCWNSSGNLDLM
jgi:hypothetical protein